MHSQSPHRHRIRRFTMSLALTFLTMLTAAGGGVPAASAQLSTISSGSVTVSGVGIATAIADHASVQLIIGRGEGDFGFSQSASGSSAHESISTDSSGDSGERKGKGERARDREAKQSAISQADLDPIIAAIANASGVTPDTIVTTFSPQSVRPGRSRPAAARLEFTLPQPTPEGITATITAASDAAAERDLVVEITGVRYEPASCPALQEAAEKAAIADAAGRAERLARLLNLQLGEVTAATGDLFSSLVQDPESCYQSDDVHFESRYGGLSMTLPVFDPTAPATIKVTTIITIGYAIEQSSS